MKLRILGEPVPEKKIPKPPAIAYVTVETPLGKTMELAIMQGDRIGFTGADIGEIAFHGPGVDAVEFKWDWPDPPPARLRTGDTFSSVIRHTIR